MKDIFALRLYTRVARLGSFSAAARECKLSQSQASRIVADLEASLGARLLSRTTRAVVPTEAGSEFLARLEPILSALEEAEHSVREGGELRGLVRMSMAASIGLREVIPRLQPFAARHPNLQIEIQMDDRRQDLVRDAVDVAIRVGRLIDSTATAKLIKTVPRVAVASPGYLRDAEALESPGQLTEHRIVGGPATAVPNAWAFERNGKEVRPDLQANFTTNENEGAVAAAVAGLGITSTTLFSCEREIEQGLLVRLFQDWTMAQIPVHAYFPLGRDTRAAGRAIVDYLIAEMQRDRLAEPSQVDVAPS
ncbi:LysR family transcriptional regulator [Sphingomonas faeni]|uniref:LysR family transcriptional regulator n=1 Tax=Sphingomonas faeni TaxID=185950 RepID=UPI00336232EA